jgi:hypothetical protein
MGRTSPRRFAVFLSLCCTLSACVSDAEDGSSRDGGALDGSVGDLRTSTPDEWLARCDEPSSCPADASRACPSRSECDALRSVDVEARERAALAINARVSRGLSQLHFARGRRQPVRVGDLLEGGGTLIDVADANRAFAGGLDRGVLTPWVATDVCATASALDVEGPEPQRCIAFDSACARGRYDAEAECCSAEHLTRGTLCGEAGRCDGSGACLPASQVLDGVAAPFDWLAVFPDGYPDEALIARRVADVVQVGVAPAGLPDDSVEIREPIDELLLARLAPGAAAR